MKNISTSIGLKILHHLEDLLQLGVPPRLPPQPDHPEGHPACLEGRGHFWKIGLENP